MKTYGKQTVLITGATGGLGRAFVVECARRGWIIFLTDKASGPLETLAEKMRAIYSAEVHTCACDLVDPIGREGLFRELEISKICVTLLINVAGVDFEGLFLNQSSVNLLTMLRLDVEAPIELIHKMLKIRKKSTPFRIINVSSLAAFYPMPHKAVYAACKRLLLDFSLALGMELQRENATVTVLCPAGMPTNPWCIQAIDAQGWAGQVTTKDVGRVAYDALESAFKGKSVVIPGWINRLTYWISALIPTPCKMRWITSRWEKVRVKRISIGELQTL
jgi:uncharacterized protein